ncbi:MAG: Fibronectin-binding protein (FBP) [Phormidium sp. OSCR]|nr:MAG: Fibronectin-binding protein (FBP) [Phormidium sp. OSCR]
MNIRQLIDEEISKLEEEQLAEIYEIVKDFSRSQSKTNNSLFTKLKQVKLEGPVDFAANVDLYLNGEKKIDGG